MTIKLEEFKKQIDIEDLKVLNLENIKDQPICDNRILDHILPDCMGMECQGCPIETVSLLKAFIKEKENEN